MTLFESIFTCSSKGEDEGLRELKEEVRDIKAEVKSIWREIDLRVEVCNNKLLALQSSIDLKFDLINNKIDILLNQNKNS